MYKRQVQGRVITIGKTAFHIVKLVGGNPQIQHKSVYSRNSKVLYYLRRVTVIIPYQSYFILKWLQSLRCGRQGLFILIDPDQMSVSQPPANFTAVPAASQRPVQIDPVRLYGKSFDCFI